MVALGGLALYLYPAPASAGLIPGGGRAASDCYAEFNVQGVDGTSNRIDCTDGDPACDSDGECQGICTFRIALCLNQTNIPGCTPKSLRKPARVFPPLVPVPSGEGDSTCGAFTDVPVDLRGRSAARLKLRTRVIENGRPRDDRDTLYLTCHARNGECPTSTTTTTGPVVTSTTSTTVPTTTTVSTTTSTSTTTVPTTTSTSTTSATTTTVPTTTSTSTTSTTASTTTSTMVVVTTSTTATTTSTTSTTTTATTSSTTTTTLQSFTKLSFTTTLGSTGCGGPSFSGFTAPTAPFSGEVDNSSNTKIGDLGKGCLYVGGGSAGTPANQIPDQAQSLFDLGTPSGGNVPLIAHAGAQSSCTKGAGPGKHCIGGSGGPIACTADSDCGGTAGSCALDANCTFGPPLPITGALPVCVINAIQTDASGTATPATGASTVDIPLSSRVYLTANATSPCPTCISGHCDATWKDGSNNPSPNSGAACSPTGSQATSLACGLPLGDYQGALPVDLNPLSTGPASKTAANGIFCTGQGHAGAFHLTTATAIKETGSPAGDITDGGSHASVLASVFCIPASLSAAINAVGDLPGPGATALGGNAQLLP